LNVTPRIVETQRREIGIGMGLGVPDEMLAVRPLLFGTQVALIGVTLGVAGGWLIAIPRRAMFVDLVPLSVWRPPFQPASLSQAVERVG
jgi:putative ABC transport system permease protein